MMPVPADIAPSLESSCRAHPRRRARSPGRRDDRRRRGGQPGLHAIDGKPTSPGRARPSSWPTLRGMRLAGGLPGDPRPLRPREPRPERGPFPPRRPPAGVEFRCPLGVAAAIGLNLRAVRGRSLRGRPHNTPPDGSAAAAAVLIRGSDPPGARAGIGTGQRYPGEPAPPPGGVGGQARMQVAPEVECPLGPPR